MNLRKIVTGPALLTATLNTSPTETSDTGIETPIDIITEDFLEEDFRHPFMIGYEEGLKTGYRYGRLIGNIETKIETTYERAIRKLENAINPYHNTK